MARPVKNNCDYFPHDRDMRNHKKVKAIRNKFPNGYAIWVMTLEHLTGSDGNVFPHSDLEFELMAGDFGFSVTEIRDVVNYCISLELLFLRNGFVNSDSLDERLAPVFEKRNKAKELSKQQLRSNGKYVTETPQEPVVTVTETPQSKVKESTVNEIKVDEVGAAEPLAPKYTVDERKKMFGEKCAIHLDEFGQVMLREFFNYWTEISEGGRKMRFEKEKTWELHKRLLKWKENSIKFSKNGKSGQQTDNHTKNTLDLMEGFKRRNADIFEGGQV